MYIAICKQFLSRPEPRTIVLQGRFIGRKNEPGETHTPASQLHEGEAPPKLPNIPKRRSWNEVAWSSVAKEARYCSGPIHGLTRYDFSAILAA